MLACEPYGKPDRERFCEPYGKPAASRTETKKLASAFR